MPTFDAPTPIRAIVDLGFGTLRVTATAQSTSTTVQVLPTDPTSHKDVKAAERTQVDYSDGRLRITDPGYGSRAWLARAGSVEVTVDLPECSHLEARIDTGDLRGEGHLGEVRVHSAHGEVRLDRADMIDIKADSGTVVLNEVSAQARAETTYLGIEIGTLGGAARLRSGTGDIAVEHALGDLDARSKDGHIRIGEIVRGCVQVETGSGSLDLGVGGKSKVQLDVEAKHGSVRNLLTSGPAAETVDVRAVSLHGDIVLRRTSLQRI